MAVVPPKAAYVGSLEAVNEWISKVTSRIELLSLEDYKGGGWMWLL